jgi:hypothetical protein
MDILEPSPVEPSRVGTLVESQWRPVLVGALVAMVVFGTVATVVAAIGTTVAQVTAVVAAASSESMARNAQAHSPPTCGLASR